MPDEKEISRWAEFFNWGPVWLMANLDKEGNLKPLQQDAWAYNLEFAKSIAGHRVLEAIIVAKEQRGVPQDLLVEGTKPLRIIRATKLQESIRELRLLRLVPLSEIEKRIGDNISIAIEEGIDMGKRSSQGDERDFWMSRGGFSEWRERIIAERMSNINQWLNNFDFVREHLKELEALERMKGLADEDIEFFRSMGIKIEE